MGFRSILFSLLLSCLIAFFLPGDGRVPWMNDWILIEHLKEHVRNLQGVREPYGHYQELQQAAQYLREEMLKTGLRVWEEPFEWEGREFKNIIGERKGTISPERVYIVGAHYDTVTGSPGADDNASGLAVLLELARNLRAVSTDSTIRLIAFCLEEYGYIGSMRYAERARKEGEQIPGMISIEMVGYTGRKQDYPPYINPKHFPNVGDFAGIIGNVRSKELLERVSRCFKAFVPHLPVELLVVPGNGEGMEEVRLSDHGPFWDQGFQALMVTDTAFLRNPNYHLPGDTMETLDFEFMRKVGTGIFYSILELAKS